MTNLETKIEQTRQRLLDLQSRARKLERKNDARRKVLYGVAVMALLEDLTNEKRQNTLHRLHQKITKQSDREFLGLQRLHLEKGSESKGE